MTQVSDAEDAKRNSMLIPPTWGVTLDPEVRRANGGRVLIGGSPLRLLRLAPAGVDLVAGWEAGEEVGTSPAARRLARRLLDAGLADPRPAGPTPFRPADVTVVIPVRDDGEGLAATLAALADGAEIGAIVVVDDGSHPPVGDDHLDPSLAGARFDVEVVRRPQPGGPGVARDVGLAVVRTPLVAFLDAGTRPSAEWLAVLLPHFADETVAAVAPRVTSLAGDGLLDRFESHHSPLDLGAAAGRVAPRTSIAYVPTAALVARAAAIRRVGGFDAGLRFGEDVDLVWRLVADGWTVRYVPDVVVAHEPRASWRSWFWQRVGYGTAAAPLARRHPGSVPPLQVSAWSASAWSAVAAGHPLVGIGLAATSTALLPRKLGALEHPWPEALRLAGRGHLHAGRWIARALTRTWWPLALLAALVSRRACRAVLAAAIVPAMLDWRARHPPVDPVRYVGLRLADDVAYGTGVWLGCVRERSLGPLRPDLTSWPGRRRADRGVSATEA